MITTATIIQLAVSLSILNVWLFRRDKATSYRGATAMTLLEEFRAYGFPDWVYYTVGPVKVLTAILMIVAIWNPMLLFPSTLCMAGMMLTALICHLRIRQDSLTKAIPAGTIFLLCAVILTISRINRTLGFSTRSGGFYASCSLRAACEYLIIPQTPIFPESESAHFCANSPRKSGESGI